MFLKYLYTAALGVVSLGSALHLSGDLYVDHKGEPVGFMKNVSGVQIYHSYHNQQVTTGGKAVLYVSDIFGLGPVEAKLLADAIARANYTVIMPDLFNGDPVPVDAFELGLNLTDWITRHPASAIDRIITQTIDYMRSDLKIERIGGVGYCFGGKYVPRFLAKKKGIDVGFIAHPSNLLPEEIKNIVGPVSISAGELDASFNSTARFNAESILSTNNRTYESALYSRAPHGYAVRPDVSVPQQKYAKEASYFQAVLWFMQWL